MASDDYWEQWNDWMDEFIAVDKACDAFLRNRPEWSLVKYRWDNPDRLLSGPVRDGFWGNIHILFVPEASTFRFTYAAWRDEDQGVDHGHRVSMRFWSTSNDDGSGDQHLSLHFATVTHVKQRLDQAWDGLLRLSRQSKFRKTRIALRL